MKPTQPWPGLMILTAMVGATVVGNGARAQFGGFSLDGDADGGDGGGLLTPRKLVSNPWKADAGKSDAGGFGLDGVFKGFEGGGSGFLKTRAPAINDLIESDASILPGGGDGGSFSFSIPTFGADVDAGRPDAGPVVAPTIRVARPLSDVEPLTAMRLPPGLVWARLPEPLVERMVKSWPRRDEQPVSPRFASLTKEDRRALWSIAATERGWSEGSPGFVLSDVGWPVKVALVALGARLIDRTLHLYGGFVAPRDGVQPKGPRVVLAASGNVGTFANPQPERLRPNANLRRAVEALAASLGTPFGSQQPPKVGRIDAVGVRTREGVRALIRAMEAQPRASRPPLCFEAILDDEGRPKHKVDWSPACGHVPLTAVDVDGDGFDEVVWAEDGRLSLRTHPEGLIIDQDPPDAER